MSKASVSYALSSDLQGAAAAAVSYLWDILEARFSIRAAKAAIRPHVSYLVGTCPDEAQRHAFARAAGDVVMRTRVFSLTLDGLSSFDTDPPVLFLRVGKSPELERLYDKLWQCAGENGFAVDAHYHPATWTPHCTLALHDIGRESIPGVREFLRTQTLHWRTQITSVDFVRVVEPAHEYVHSWNLAGAAPPGA